MGITAAWGKKVTFEGIFRCEEIFPRKSTRESWFPLFGNRNEQPILKMLYRHWAKTPHLSPLKVMWGVSRLV